MTNAQLFAIDSSLGGQTKKANPHQKVKICVG